MKISQIFLSSAFFDINQKQTMNVKKYGYIKLRDAATVSGTPQCLDSDGFPRQLDADPRAKTGTALHRNMIGCTCIQPQAARPSAAAPTPAAFRKERREMNFDITISPSTKISCAARRLVQAALPLMALV